MAISHDAGLAYFCNHKNQLGIRARALSLSPHGAMQKTGMKAQKSEILRILVVS